jgi:2'-5' RNA ligase
MRTFIAIEVPAEVRAIVAAIQKDLSQVNADVAWTDSENIHLTLKFLGEIDKKLFTEVEHACQELASGFNVFTLNLKGIGAFPSARHPRVLWVGLAGATKLLEEMQERLEERLSAIGFEDEEKDFSPHLTIGRVKSNKNTHELIARADLYPIPALSFEVREIVLMKSDLYPEGARYCDLARVKLAV